MMLMSLKLLGWRFHGTYLCVLSKDYMKSECFGLDDCTTISAQSQAQLAAKSVHETK